MHRLPWLIALIIFAALAASARADLERKFQVEARGPLHEAYAQPWEANPKPNQPISEEPPAAINEEPPDERPPGKNVQWIPGYWQWDNDKKDFVWVSGLWREVPTG